MTTKAAAVRQFHLTLERGPPRSPLHGRSERWRRRLLEKNFPQGEPSLAVAGGGTDQRRQPPLEACWPAASAVGIRLGIAEQPPAAHVLARLSSSTNGGREKVGGVRWQQWAASMRSRRYCAVAQDVPWLRPARPRSSPDQAQASPGSCHITSGVASPRCHAYITPPHDLTHASTRRNFVGLRHTAHRRHGPGREGSGACF